ncbi:MAG: hypothetical protein ACOZQL_09135 [Myxococcota bacterium]
MRARALALLLSFASGCGEVLEPPAPDAGRPCTADSECVPNGCCGEGTAATHVLDAPSCSTVMCPGQCPEAQVRCGCGLPVCRDARCTVAVSVEPRCG